MAKKVGLMIRPEAMALVEERVRLLEEQKKVEEIARELDKVDSALKVSVEEIEDSSVQLESGNDPVQDLLRAWAALAAAIEDKEREEKTVTRIEADISDLEQRVAAKKSTSRALIGVGVIAVIVVMIIAMSSCCAWVDSLGSLAM